MTTEDLTVKIEIAEALVLKPGDRVLLLTKDTFRWGPGDIEHAQELLKGRFPDVEFTFASGVNGAVIQPAAEGGRCTAPVGAHQHSESCGRTEADHAEAAR